MSEVIYNSGKLRIANGATDLDGANLRAILAVHASTALGAGWNDPDLATVAALDAVADVTLKLTDRVTLTGLTITEDSVNNRVAIDCADLSFAAEAANFARAIFIYDEGGGADASRHLIYGSNTNFPQPLDGGLTVQVSDWLRLV